MSFMKKAWILLKSYPLIKRVELEVEEVKDSIVTESIPTISKSVCLSVCLSSKLVTLCNGKILTFSRHNVIPKYV